MATEQVLLDGRVTLVEDAKTASLVIVGRDLATREEKIAALEAALQALRD